jgi:hypothetical protein
MRKMARVKQSIDANKPVKINRLLLDVFENKKWQSKLELHRVFEFWNSIVGSEIAAIKKRSAISAFSSTALWRLRSNLKSRNLNLSFRTKKKSRSLINSSAL